MILLSTLFALEIFFALLKDRNVGWKSWKKSWGPASIARVHVHFYGNRIGCARLSHAERREEVFGTRFDHGACLRSFLLDAPGFPTPSSNSVMAPWYQSQRTYWVTVRKVFIRFYP